MGIINNKFYSLNKINKIGAVYNMIIGERSNGKTYAVLKHGIEEFIKDGGQIGIVRRWQEDIRGRRASSLFDALIANNEVEKITKGKYKGVYYYAGKFYLCNYDDETGKAVYNDNDLLGFAFALSDTEHNKSISYPNIKTIMFDEFLTKGTYLPDEFVLFMNTISTIVRQRTDVTIYMLGNTVNKYSPYFREMGLDHIQHMKQGTIDVYNYGKSSLKVAVEYCQSMKKSKANNFYFAFDNPKLKMITGGAWEVGLYPHCPIKYKPKDVIFTYFINFNDRLYQCEVVDKNNNCFTFIHEKTTPLKDPENDLIYSLEYDPRINYHISIKKPFNQLTKNIYNFFVLDKVYYQDNPTGEAINNYLKEC